MGFPFRWGKKIAPPPRCSWGAVWFFYRKGKDRNYKKARRLCILEVVAGKISAWRDSMFFAGATGAFPAGLGLLARGYPAQHRPK